MKRALRGAGDQGVDLLLRKGKERVAVQCKNYQRPVGNRPVQEVFAGKQHYGAKDAWVVAPAGFTKGAVQLARSTGVGLFDHSSVERLIQQTERRSEEQQASTNAPAPREQSAGGSEKQTTRRNSPARTTQGTIDPQRSGPLATTVGDVPVILGSTVTTLSGDRVTVHSFVSPVHPSRYSPPWGRP